MNNKVHKMAPNVYSVCVYCVLPQLIKKKNYCMIKNKLLLE